MLVDIVSGMASQSMTRVQLAPFSATLGQEASRRRTGKTREGAKIGFVNTDVLLRKTHVKVRLTSLECKKNNY